MLLEGYAELLNQIKHRIISARISAAREINKALIHLYWDIGRDIAEKQAVHGWGDAVVEKLAADLRRELPSDNGYSESNLWRMRKLYVAYSAPEFLAQAAPEIGDQRTTALAVGQQKQIVDELLAPVPWGHHVELLNKIKSHAARVFYLRAIAKFGWTRKVLLNQIKAKCYDRSLSEEKSHNFNAALPANLAQQAEQVLKSSYSLGFLGMTDQLQERELESRLIERLWEFILELGYGFCFIGRQYRLTLGENEYFIDLLFYHRFLKSLVAIELKLGEFEPEFSGKLDFYLNVLNENERAADDNPSIGIILCAEKDDVVVEFSLKTKSNPIGVAKYELTSDLPRELRGQLPTAREFREALMEGRLPAALSAPRPFTHLKRISRKPTTEPRRSRQQPTEKLRARSKRLASKSGLSQAKRRS